MKPSAIKPAKLSLLVGSAILAGASSAASACAACGCTLDSQLIAPSASPASHWSIDSHIDYIDQDQLRSGRGTISAVAASALQNANGPQEVEQYTRNTYETTSISYLASYHWSAELQLPFVHREHATLGTGSDGVNPAAGGGAYASSTSGIGDARLLFRYHDIADVLGMTALFGVKLPTGSHTQTGTSTDPASLGQPVQLDRGLQAGTGTTDLIVGGEYRNELARNWSYMASVKGQFALDSRDMYRSGNSAAASLGVAYQGLGSITPRLQVNAKWAEHDRGDNADTFGTGGTLVYLAPGASVEISKQIALYSFVQLPVFQDLHGVQLAPRYNATVGMKAFF